MTGKREFTEADVDAAVASAFGHAAPVTEAEADAGAAVAKAFGHVAPPAKPAMTLERAEDVRMGRVFGRAGLTVEMAREAEAVIADHAAQVSVVETEQGMSAAQEAQLEAARLRAAAAAASQGRTAAEATGYSHALLAHVQTTAVAEGRSFGEVIDLIDRVAESLRKTPRGA